MGCSLSGSAVNTVSSDIVVDLTRSERAASSMRTRRSTVRATSPIRGHRRKPMLPLARSPSSRAQPGEAHVQLAWISRSGQDLNLRRFRPRLVSSEFLSTTQAPLHSSPLWAMSASPQACVHLRPSPVCRPLMSHHVATRTIITHAGLRHAVAHIDVEHAFTSP